MSSVGPGETIPVKGALDVIHRSGDITKVHETPNISDSLILTGALALGVGYKVAGAPTLRC